MSQTVITEAFEQWKAQQATNGQAVVLDEFVFANVPNLDVNAPIDRTAGMPPVAQIVYRQAVEKTGLVNENAVVYSVTLGADVGDFSFNWIGLVNKSTGTLAMVVHAPVQSKVKNANGQQGNVLTRSFLMEYNGAETQTLISTPAETWQIDFTARLAGMDEALRLANLDIYGAGAFFESGFLVNKTANQYFVTAGVGYIGGLRAVLEANRNVTVTTKPITVWADVSYSGTLTSAYQTEIKFTLATALTDYEQSGIIHRVFALASIDANGAITDLRPKGSSQYLRRDKNLADIADPAAALNTLNGVPKIRKVNNKDLAADITLNPDDVGALSAGGTAVAATKLATARKIAGVAFDGTSDINISPANVGSLPAGGTAVAATKLETVRKIAGVAFDGTKDISLTAGGVGAVPVTGGNVGYLNNATYYGINPGAWEGAGGFASQYENGVAPFFIPHGYMAPKDISAYFPVIKGVINTATYDYGTAVSFGALTSGGQEFASAVIHVIGDSGFSAAWVFDPMDGSFSCPGSVSAANIYSNAEIYEQGQRISTQVDAQNRANTAENNAKNYALSAAKSAEDSAYNRAVAWARSQSVINVSGATWWSKDISGKITQGGVVFGNGGYVAVNFPTAFPNKCFEVQLTLANGDVVNSKDNVFVTVITNTAFQAVMHSNEYGAYWQATGY